MITSVAAIACLLPTQSYETSADVTNNYHVTGGTLDRDYSSLASAFNAINSNTGTEFIIVADGEDLNVSAFVLNSGKNVILKSSDDGPFMLKISSGRHGTVDGGLTLENIILDGNTLGGGITVNAAGTLTMNSGAVIQNCYAVSNNGGGVISKGAVVMNSGSVIRDSGAQYDGGAVHISGDKGSFTMEGGLISNNKAGRNGGGVTGIIDCLITLNGGTISNNTAERGDGGGVSVSYGKFIMNGGTITGNKVISFNNDNNDGGGVFCDTMSAAVMNGGTISNNEAQSGGGILIVSGGTFTMNDGTISGNTAYWAGGGVAGRGGKFTMEGGIISGNKSEGTLWLQGGGGVYIEGNPFTMSGGTVSDNTAVQYGGGVLVRNDTRDNTSFTMSGGTISRNTADRGGGVSVISGTYDLCEFTMSGGTIRHNTATQAGGGVHIDFSIFIMVGGTIGNNSVTHSGGGIYGSSSAIVNIGGTAAISKNNAGNGGGIYNSGVLSMGSNAKITNNAAADPYLGANGGYGGGVYNNGRATFSMTGGEVSRNTADQGGGFYNAATLSIDGGAVSNNTAKSTGSIGSGGGIYTTNFAKLTIANGVTLSGNNAPTLRIKDIAAAVDADNNGTRDLDDYAGKIGAVVLDARVNTGQNAPAYNNYDINYPGDVYLVFIDIVDDGAGTVTVSNINDGTEYGVLSADGYVRVPNTVDTITILAAAGSKYEFKRFIVDNTLKSFSNPLSVPISGDMFVVAEFFDKYPPEQKSYTIIATADNGSKIIPSGAVNVYARADEVFIFSATEGYHITEVYVDGVEISLAQAAAGVYIFHCVLENHEISVVSISDGGGGKPPVSPPETGSGGGKPPVSPPETGSGGGKPPVSPPEAGGGSGGTGKWAILNLIYAVAAIFCGLAAVVGGRNRIKKEKDDGAEKGGMADEDEREGSRAALLFRAAALAIGVVSVAVFFLTEDWSLPVAITDKWTLLMLILLAANIVVAASSFRFDEAADKPEDRAEV